MIQATLPQLVKLGSIARHAEELIGTTPSGEPGGHEFDAGAIRALLADPDVTKVMGELDEAALLPVKR